MVIQILFWGGTLSLRKSDLAGCNPDPPQYIHTEKIKGAGRTKSKTLLEDWTSFSERWTMWGTQDGWSQLSLGKASAGLGHDRLSVKQRAHMTELLKAKPGVPRLLLHLSEKGIFRVDPNERALSIAFTFFSGWCSCPTLRWNNIY